MKTKEETLNYFNSLTSEEKSTKVAQAWDKDGNGYIVFGPIGWSQINLTPEQIETLTPDWQKRAKKHLADCAITGCTLLAGEETAIICQGTLSQCISEVGLLPHKNLPRDPYTGKGCWLIVQGDKELRSGYFDKDIAY
jgi:hypothetical protein